MKYRSLGQSPLQVSSLCLGTMMFGDQTDAAEAAKIMARAYDQGINFLDTADVYTRGASESMIGQLLQGQFKGQRDAWVIATKLGNDMNRPTNANDTSAPKQWPNNGGYSRKWVHEACNNSLRRLQTDYIDIYYLHRDFEDQGLEEPVSAIGDLLRAGKIRYFGLSNFRGWRIVQLVAECRRQGVALPIVCQPYYNLLNRQPEVEILPACGGNGMGVVPYSPIARGVLTGKYKVGEAAPEGSRAARADRRMMQTEWRDESIEIAQALQAHAAKQSISLAQWATAWVLANRFVSSVIVGPKTLTQFEEYFGAIDYQWTPEDEAIVDQFVPKGYASSFGYHDPAYPFVGR